MLFAFQSRLTRSIGPVTPEQSLRQSNTLISSSFIDVADQRWRIVCVPAWEFFQRGTSSTPWVVFSAGWLLTVALGIYVVLNLRNNSRTTRLTQELLGANDQLNAEIIERIGVEETLSAARATGRLNHRGSSLTSWRTWLIS